MKNLLVLTIAVMLSGLTTSTYGQVKVDLKGKTEHQVNNRANERTDQGINKGLDILEDGIRSAFRKKDKESQQSQSQGEDDNRVAVTDTRSDKPGTGTQERTALESYSKFDFVPGEKVIFFDDFSQDAVGDFPALWNTNGSAEIVTTNLYPGNWMRFSCEEAIWTDELLNLPDNYTIEFDVIPVSGNEGGMAGYCFRMIKSINKSSYDHGAVPGKAGFLFVCEYYGRPGYRTYMNVEGGEALGLTGETDNPDVFQKENQKYHVSVWVQKARVRLYLNEKKLFDLPRAFSLPGISMDRIRFEDGAAMISNVRIAVGAPDIRNKLMTEGKLVTYGIYFDVNKDVVKPESYATLKEIATILNEIPDVRVKITGHTDSDGADAANLDLSSRRAASVKDELVRMFNVKPDRLETDGMGESQPVAPNDTPVNKALNRRVEFIKL
jgi:OmpA-OmpF porin, OOP family